MKQKNAAHRDPDTKKKFREERAPAVNAIRGLVASTQGDSLSRESVEQLAVELRDHLPLGIYIDDDDRLVQLVELKVNVVEGKIACVVEAADRFGRALSPFAADIFASRHKFLRKDDASL